MTGEVRRLQVSGGATTAAGATRELLVWLPPGYSEPANARAKYPVIYLHDGQNVFETAPGAAAEWKADEIATSLITRHMMSPAIIVAVPNAGQGRNSEYMPVSGIAEIPAAGAIHTAWLLNEVKPRVEAAFRVKTGPENTGIGGSSLGAAISLYAATTHPEAFGLLLAESLPLRTGDAKVWDSFVAGVKTWPKRVYLGIGGAELGSDAKNAERNKAYVDAVKSLDSVLDKAGLGPDRRLLVIDQAAQHNEEAWSKRLPQALSFLFPPPMDGTK
ncbi:MAG: alpha/beta hydrolase-fold protein [Planctomycetota bacterium]|nr:alpha/beta hydrolase-fold protein [Planctomycetota bacterium]